MKLSPLNLQDQLPRPTRRFPLLPILDVALILLFFGLFQSGFVVAPGLSLELPRTAGEPVDHAARFRILTVEEVEGSELLIFEGRVLNLAGLERLLPTLEKPTRDEVLLIRLDRRVSLETLVRISEVARDAGFERIHLAAESAPAAAAPF
ncbi:MAG: biopolymer transporter ExbD [Puniceicoccaceae bacterium]|nr:MAG: biopolymer transporter ExbD [Puniceicoccaceae bacterium]